MLTSDASFARSTGCTNWGDVILKSWKNVFTNPFSCQILCQQTQGCATFNLQAFRCEDTSKGMGVGTCLLYKRGCSEELNQCWDLYDRGAIEAAAHIMSPVRTAGMNDTDGSGWAGVDLPEFTYHLSTPQKGLSEKWIPADAVVVEANAKYGASTCAISQALDNSGLQVAISPNPDDWEILERNVDWRHCNVHILKGTLAPEEIKVKSTLNTDIAGLVDDARRYREEDEVVDLADSDKVLVPSVTLKAVEAALGRRIDTLLINCDGCLQDMSHQIEPPIKSGQIKLLIVKEGKEEDFEDFFNFLRKSDMEQIDKVNDCDADGLGKVNREGCVEDAYHYVFKQSHS